MPAFHRIARRLIQRFKTGTLLHVDTVGEPVRGHVDQQNDRALLGAARRLQGINGSLL